MKSEKNYRRFGIFCLLGALLLVGIDQLLKYWTLEVVVPAGRIPGIPGIFDFSFVANTGAAFGILQGKTMMLGIISTVFLLAIVGVILLDKVKDRFLIVTLSLIVAGGFGNVIDRFARGYVVDFIDLRFWIFKDFPIFNFADICVTVGAFLLIFYMIYIEIPSSKNKSSDPTEQDDVL